MMHGRSYRRWQEARAKRHAYDLWRVWHFDRHGEMPSGHWLGVMASTHCKPCSCPSCGNPRRHFGERTRQERRADQSWFWTREWQAGEAQVDAAIAAGEYDEYETIDGFLADL